MPLIRANRASRARPSITPDPYKPEQRHFGAANPRVCVADAYPPPVMPEQTNMIGDSCEKSGLVHRRIHSLSDLPLGEANECVDALPTFCS